MIIDDNRKKAVVHPVNNSMYIRHFTDEDMLLLQKTENMEDEYTDMWKTFFEAIAIKQRRNTEC